MKCLSALVEPGHTWGITNVAADVAGHALSGQLQHDGAACYPGEPKAKTESCNLSLKAVVSLKVLVKMSKKSM